MLQTYKAVLRGNKLEEWSGGAPKQLDTERGIEVCVTILQDTAISLKTASHGKAMAEALEEIAVISSPSSISGPSAWQSEQRKDRALPDRDT